MDPLPSAVLAPLKLFVSAVTTQVVGMLGVLLFLGFDASPPAIAWIALPAVVGVADLILIPAVGSTVRPLPYGATPEDLRRISVGVLRTVIMLRVVLAEAAAVFGLVSAIAAHSLVPFAIGFVFAVPLLLIYAYPGRRMVGAVRTRLESGHVRV